MKKTIFRSLTVTAIAALGILWYELSYAPFTPLKFDDQYGLVSVKVRPGFYNNLARVLTEYEIPFKKDGRQIYM